MEDGTKEDPAQSKEPKFLGKAGWVKKATGRLLASYKDRYIHVEKTEILVYETEDLQNCLERLDLENYDECHELRSPFKKKHRLILIRSNKPGNKVHDVKFQAQTAEEKEAWIKALIDGINRAKNKVFDEVMVDEGSNLEHVTRSRPKGNRNRRPPTRIHMKEVAVVSSDGILRLDLDLENAMMPNGNHYCNVDGTETPKEAIKVPSAGEEEAQTEPEVSPQKKVIKPPMPPTKEAKPSPLDETDMEEGPEKKVLKPPMPPSKEAKPCASPGEEATEEAKVENMSEKSPDVSKKTGPPPAPPNKPNSSNSMSNLAEASQSEPNSHPPTPPTPPSKENKPSHPAVEPDQEAQGTTDENKEKEESNEEEAAGTTVETDEEHQPISEEALPSVKDDKPMSPGAGGQLSEDKSEVTISSGKESDNEPQVATESLDRQHTGDDTITLQTNEGLDPTALLQTASDTSASSHQEEEALPKSEAPSVVASLDEPVPDSLSLSPLLCHLPGEKKKKAEEKSVDSGQHSDDDSEASGNEDTLGASTAALRGSHPGLEVFDISKEDIKIPVSLNLIQTRPKPQVRPKGLPCLRSEPTPPLKPSTKAKSASIGDLLSNSSLCIEVKKHAIPAGAGGDRAPHDDVMKLETEVALQMEKTRELLSEVSQSQAGGNRDGKPEDLLTKAMEKLKKADHVLREVNKLKLAKNSSNRKSW